MGAGRSTRSSARCRTRFRNCSGAARRRRCSLPRSSTPTPSNRLLASVLRGEAAAPEWTPELRSAAVDAMARERVGPLVHAAGIPDTWPPEFREQARRDARACALVETVQRRELERLTRAIAAASIETVFFKGAAL